MLSQKQQLIIGAVLVGTGLVALTFAKWFADDIVFIAGLGFAYALGRFSR